VAANAAVPQLQEANQKTGDSVPVCRSEINLNEHSTTYSTAFLSKSLIIRSGKSISDTLVRIFRYIIT
jgi:hypothetical protein